MNIQPSGNDGIIDISLQSNRGEEESGIVDMEIAQEEPVFSIAAREESVRSYDNHLEENDNWDPLGYNIDPSATSPITSKDKSAVTALQKAMKKSGLPKRGGNFEMAAQMERDPVSGKTNVYTYPASPGAGKCIAFKATWLIQGQDKHGNPIFIKKSQMVYTSTKVPNSDSPEELNRAMKQAFQLAEIYTDTVKATISPEKYGLQETSKKTQRVYDNFRKSGVLTIKQKKNKSEERMSTPELSLGAKGYKGKISYNPATTPRRVFHIGHNALTLYQAMDLSYSEHANYITESQPMSLSQKVENRSFCFASSQPILTDAEHAEAEGMYANRQHQFNHHMDDDMSLYEDDQIRSDQIESQEMQAQQVRAQQAQALFHELALLNQEILDAVNNPQYANLRDRATNLAYGDLNETEHEQVIVELKYLQDLYQRNNSKRGELHDFSGGGQVQQMGINQEQFNQFEKNCITLKEELNYLHQILGLNPL